MIANLNVLPVESNGKGGLTAARSGWSVGSDAVHGRFPDDVIAWPWAFDDPRGIEHLTRFVDGHEEQPVTLEAIDPDEPIYPCTFCSPPDAVRERGIIDSDYEIKTLDGELLGFTCYACVSDAPKPPDEYDLEVGQRVHYESSRQSWSGTVSEVDKESGRATVNVDDKEMPHNVRIERLEVED